MHNAEPSFSNQPLALDEAGLVRKFTVGWCVALNALIFALGVGIVAYGDVALPVFPQFVPLHVAFVFIVDAVTAFLLMGQFHYRRFPVYLILGSGYFFNSAISIPFLLTFPEVVQTKGGIIGGPQSAIWLWHYWHIVFPAFIVTSLVVHRSGKGRHVTADKLWPLTFAATAITLALVVVLTASVTVGHHWMPKLIDVTLKPPLTPAFYAAGTMAAVMTALAWGLAWNQGRRGIVLFLWLAVALSAFLVDVAASLGAYERYTVGWYFGRVAAMVATSVLLLVFLHEITRLYQRLGMTIRQLGDANEELLRLVEEKRQAEANLAQKNVELGRLSRIDYLTQLCNRQSIETHIHELMESERRYNRPFSVVILDVDHFKRINDDYGHDVGDQVLRQLSGILSHRIRATDAAARWGGEEFLIVCAETDLEHATDLAEALREAIATAPFGPPSPVTASFGVTQYRHDEELHALIRRADHHLYIGKKTGRNRVVAA